MSAKCYKLRNLPVENGGLEETVDMDLEFEGERAFVIWDSITLGKFQLKARLEIDPNLLQQLEPDPQDFLYCGRLVLPRPQDN